MVLIPQIPHESGCFSWFMKPLVLRSKPTIHSSVTLGLGSHKPVLPTAPCEVLPITRGREKEGGEPAGLERKEGLAPPGVLIYLTNNHSFSWQLAPTVIIQLPSFFSMTQSPHHTFSEGRVASHGALCLRVWVEVAQGPFRKL